MKAIKNTILYCMFVRTFVIPFCSGTVINYGSGSDLLINYGFGSTRQKNTVPVPQHCLAVYVWLEKTADPDLEPDQHPMYSKC
jgi:hypothetical protein